MQFFRRIGDVFFAPSTVYDDIRERRAGWVQPWLFVSVLGLLVTYLSFPIQRAVQDLNLMNIPQDKLDQQLAMMNTMKIASLISTPAVVILATLVVAGISYMVVSVMSPEANFKQYFTLSMFAGVIGIMGQVVSTAVIRLRGVDKIATLEDARFSLSLRPLAPPDSAVLRGLLGSFEFFWVWSTIFVVMGLMRIFGMSRSKAIAVVVPIWLMYVILMVFSEKFGGLG